MSKELFSDKCDGCRPAIFDPKTGKILPPEHPLMVAALEFWKGTTWDERFHFHQFTCLNNHTDSVMRVIGPLMSKFQKAIGARPIIGGK